MYNAAEIINCFAGLVGFRQPNDPSYPQIYGTLLTSSSGLYVQDKHALCTLENLYNVAPEFFNYNYLVWAASAPKTAGQTLRYSDGNYYLVLNTLAPNAGGTPDVDTVNYKISPLFSNWLLDLYKGSCTNLVTELIKWKKISNIGKSLLDSLQLFEGFGMLEDKIIKEGRFVGLQIFPNKQESIAIYISRMGIQVDTQQTVTFYLYHSSQRDPIKTFEVEVTRANSFSWGNFSDVVMSYMKGNQNSEGVFFLGYYEDDLQGQAISRKINFSAPCYSCGGADVSSFNRWSKHAQIVTMEVAPQYLNEDKSLFDVSTIKYNYNTNYGLNASISVMCDLTEFFCKNSRLFAEALSMQICIDILNKIAFNTRTNAISDKTKSLAMADLDPKLTSNSFRSEYLKALQALNYDFSGFSTDCLPCTNKRTIDMSGAL